MPDKNPNGGDQLGGRDALATLALAARPPEARSEVRPRAVPASPLTAPAPIRILLIDPRPLTAKAVRRFLEAATGPGDAWRFEVSAVSCAGDITAAGRFDVLLLHVSPAADVTTEIERCLAAVPTEHRSVPTAVFSDCCGADEIAAAVRSGARGYLPSTLDSGEIVEALRLLASGLAVMPPAALARLAGAPSATGAAPTDSRHGGASTLTERECEVLRGLRDGKPNKVIARDLTMSLSTVKVHVRSIFRKLGARNRTEAALAASQILPGRS